MKVRRIAANIRRFYVRDPFGKLVNTLAHQPRIARRSVDGKPGRGGGQRGGEGGRFTMLRAAV